MKKLRLFLFEECNRNCLGCSNYNWDLNALVIEKDFIGYSAIMFTGGEPMLKPSIIIDTAIMIKNKTDIPIYVYTALVTDIDSVKAVLHVVDGLTVTLHNKKDINPFQRLVAAISTIKEFQDKSLRVNGFEGVRLPECSGWVKKTIQWVKNCPLPENEVFKRLAVI